MSNTDKKNKPENSELIQDDELDSLSLDEKAAFEKIMAEINVSSGEPAQISPAEPGGDRQDSAPESDEIEGKKDNKVLHKVPSQLTPTLETEISQDPPAESAQNRDSDLDAEQQAALDKIMAEISAGEKVAPADATATDKADNDNTEKESEDLSDDQQDALNNIMAEIEGKKNKESLQAEDFTTETTSPEPDVSLNEEAAIDKIMAEIAAKKNKDRAEQPDEGAMESEPDNTHQTDFDSAQPQSDKKDGDGLSEDEFNDELNQLISSVQQSAAESAEDEAQAISKTELRNTSKAGESEDLASAENTDLSTANSLSQIKTDLNSAQPADGRTASEQSLPDQTISAPESGKTETQPCQTTGTSRTRKSKKSRKPILVVMLACMLLIIAGGAYWTHYGFPDASPLSLFAKKPQVPSTLPVHLPADADNADKNAPNMGQNAPWEQGTPSSAQETSVSDPLSRIMADLSSARQQVQSKRSEILELKNYYQKGIDDETNKIIQAMGSPDLNSYDNALKDKQIELSMRSIQRRMIYLQKLDAPLSQLEAAAEELLFYERHAHLIGILKKGVSGISSESFAEHATTVINGYMDKNSRLSIDDIEVPPIALEKVWQLVTEKFKDNARQRKITDAQDTANQAIGQEICKGDFSRKNMLTALGSETAHCLLQWTAKDLFLNDLIILNPDTAKILAQWTGEWLSLNGLEELPAESARHLAQWAGKRLSMNGLTAISAEATGYLSKWRGEQLEMIGLQSIGAWENYGTRLYLSEKLRRTLETQ